MCFTLLLSLHGPIRPGAGTVSGCSRLHMTVDLGGLSADWLAGWLSLKPPAAAALAAVVAAGRLSLCWSQLDSAQPS